MKFLFCISLICALLVATRAAQSMGWFKDPKHPGKCVVRGIILSPGEEAQEPSQCGTMFCGHDGLVTFSSCGVFVVGDGFKLGKPINPNGPYPECCELEIIEII